MTRGLLLAADGVSAIHLAYAYHRLQEDAVLVDVATPGGGSVALAGGGTRESLAVDALPPARRYDLVLVPGGEGVDRLADDEATRDLLAAHLEAGGVVGAIAEGVRLLAAAGVLTGRLVAVLPTDADAVVAAGGEPTAEAVTVDGAIVTARDTAALPFGVAATLGSVVITQDPAATARERPFWA